MQPSDVQTLMTDGGRGWCDITNPVAIAAHHSVTFIAATVQTQQTELDHLRMIDRYHASQGWGGFGYHLAGFPSGRSYLCGDIRRCRAHVAKRNHELVGIVAIGDFRGGPPGHAQLVAFYGAAEWVRAQWSRPILPIRPHRELALAAYPTACPGVWPWPAVIIEEEDILPALTQTEQRRLLDRVDELYMAWCGFKVGADDNPDDTQSPYAGKSTRDEVLLRIRKLDAGK